MGEARRAVRSARGTEVEKDRDWEPNGDDERGGPSRGFLEGEVMLRDVFVERPYRMALWFKGQGWRYAGRDEAQAR